MRRIGAMLLRRGALALAVVVLGSLGFAGVASAATFTVNDSRDLAQSPTASSGSCTSTASTCTLRAAIMAANQNGGSNTINVPAGTYNVSNSSTTTGSGYTECAGADESIGDLKVNDCNNSTSVTVIGAGSGQTVINNSTGSSGYRLFTLYPNGTLDLQKMTVENGDGSTDGYGSNFNTSAHNFASHDGGAIVSEGHLSAESVTFTGNTSTTDGGAVAPEDVPGSTGSFTGDVFQNNTAAYGGALDTDAPNDVTIAFSLLQANSSSQDGGGLEADSDSAGLTLNFDDIVQNVTASGDEGGGGVGWYGNGALTITNSLLSQNQATSGGVGGGIDSNGTSSSQVNISTTSFTGNSAASEGGALNDYDSNALNLTLDKFNGNQSTGGGALELDSAASTPTTITSSEFDANGTPGSDGGAIDWDLGPLTIQGSSFVLNTAHNGGVIDAEGGGTSVKPQLLTIVDSTMSRNTAASEGGAIEADQCNACIALTMTNDTIAFNNAASAKGGGVYSDDSPSDFTSGGSAGSGFGVENTTIAENSGGDCNQTFNKADDLGNNNDSDQTCFGGLGGPNDKTGVNPLLSNPANNGGPLAGGPGDTETLQTDAEQSGSPTVDAGNNNGCPPVDERGVKRPQGSACDIGAFEFGASPTTTTSTSTLTPPPPSTSTPPPPKPPKPKGKVCPKGKHKSHGKCVKNKKHKKHKKHHKKHKRHHKRHKK